MQEEDENAKYGGLTKEELEEAERLIDPESAIRAANISKKSYWRDVKKVVEMSDVVIQVLDARDPEGTRVQEIEDKVNEDGKKIILLLNKSDLVTEANANAWRDYLRSKKFMCILFRANLMSNDEEEESDNGAARLMTVLFKYARKF